MVVITASSNSLRRNPANRRSSPTSISRTAAKITRAPRAAFGNAANSGPATTRVDSTISNATREYSWVRLPTAAPSAVRLPLELTGNPWKSEAEMFAAASAVHSWLASIGWPAFRAKALAVSTLSV